MSGEDTNPLYVTFGDSGSRAYVTGEATNTIYALDLATDWDISPSSATLAESLDVSGVDSTPRGTAFKPDGTKMYLVGMGNTVVQAFDLSTPWDISPTSATQAESLDVSGQDGHPLDVSLNDDGSVLILAGGLTDSIYRFDLSTDWDISSSSATLSNSLALDLPGNKLKSVAFDGSEKSMIVSNDDNTTIYQYESATANSLDDYERFGAQDISGTVDRAIGIDIKPDESVLLVVDSDNTVVQEFR